VHLYHAYGLGIHSAVPLPELVAVGELEVDVVIQLGRIRSSPLATFGTGRNFHIAEGEAYLFWDQVGTFLVRSGREIIIEPSPGVEERLLRLPLLGTVFAILLYQRGALVLHSSAVSVNGVAIAFLGLGKKQSTDLRL
jgi:hypothetical protein